MHTATSPNVAIAIPALAFTPLRKRTSPTTAATGTAKSAIRSMASKSRSRHRIDYQGKGAESETEEEPERRGPLDLTLGPFRQHRCISGSTADETRGGNQQSPRALKLSTENPAEMKAHHWSRGQQSLQTIAFANANGGPSLRRRPTKPGEL